MKNDSSGVWTWVVIERETNDKLWENKKKVYDDRQHCFNGFSCIRTNGINLKLFSFRLCIQVDMYDISTVAGCSFIFPRHIELHSEIQMRKFNTERCERVEQKVNDMYNNFSSLLLAVVQYCSGIKNPFFVFSSFIHKLDPNLYVLYRVLASLLNRFHFMCHFFLPFFSYDTISLGITPRKKCLKDPSE